MARIQPAVEVLIVFMASCVRRLVDGKGNFHVATLTACTDSFRGLQTGHVSGCDELNSLTIKGGTSFYRLRDGLNNVLIGTVTKP